MFHGAAVLRDPSSIPTQPPAWWQGYTLLAVRSPRASANASESLQHLHRSASLAYQAYVELARHVQARQDVLRAQGINPFSARAGLDDLYDLRQRAYEHWQDTEEYARPLAIMELGAS